MEKIWLIEDIKEKINSISILDSQTATNILNYICDVTTPKETLDSILEQKFYDINNAKNYFEYWTMIKQMILENWKDFLINKDMLDYEELDTLYTKLNNKSTINNFTLKELEYILCYLKSINVHFICPTYTDEQEETNLKFKRIRVIDYYYIINMLQEQIIEELKRNK